ncbi:MAG: hypothetical protein AAF726_18555 [Planctomycetota bacterium]
MSRTLDFGRVGELYLILWVVFFVGALNAAEQTLRDLELVRASGSEEGLQSLDPPHRLVVGPQGTLELDGDEVALAALEDRLDPHRPVAIFCELPPALRGAFEQLYAAQTPVLLGVDGDPPPGSASTRTQPR